MSAALPNTATTTQQGSFFADIFTALNPVLGFFSDYPVAVLLTVISLSFIVAKVATSVLTGLIAQFTQRTSIPWDDQINALLKRPLFWTLFLLGILVSLIPLKLAPNIYASLHSLVLTIFIILWSRYVLQLLRIILTVMSSHAGEKAVVRPQTRPLFQNLAYIFVFIIAIYLIFASWNIDMTAWLASAGIAGIAIGFAAKDTLANLFAGVFILADSPYKIGDYVVLDSGERGKVTHIGIRSTRLLTRGDVEITIPNAVMGNTRITNESGGPYEKFRLAVKIGIAYGSDIDRVKALLLEVALDEPAVCDDPEPRVRFRAFGNSSLDLELLCWVENPELRGRALDALNTTIYKRFNAEGIEIPYSKHDIFIKEMPGNKLS